MALVSCNELFDRRDGGTDAKGRVWYSRTWEVITDDPDDGPKVASSHGDIPARGSPYVAGNDSDPLALAQEATVEQHADSPYIWYVTVKYDSTLDWPTGTQPGVPPVPGSPPAPPPPAAQQPGEWPENPLTRAPIWKGGFQSYEEAVRYDREGNPIVNSAGLPFDPPVMRKVSYPTVSVTVNRPTLDLPALQVLVDSVNSVTWKGLLPRSAWCVSADFASVVENGVAFWQMTYTFALKNPNWDEKILDAGYHYKTAAPGGGFQWVKIVDKAGREPTEPVPLNGAGGALTPGDDPEFMTFRVKRETDFVTLLV
jgi:hypothetical protein